MLVARCFTRPEALDLFRHPRRSYERSAGARRIEKPPEPHEASAGPCEAIPPPRSLGTAQAEATGLTARTPASLKGQFTRRI